MIIGIDNGLTGGIAAISAHHGHLIAAYPMPTKIRTHRFSRTKKSKRFGVTTKTTGPAINTEIDAAAVVSIIKRVTDSKPCRIVIEECPEHAQQKSTMRSMGISYGILIGAIEAALPGYDLIVVRSGNSLDSWQRAILGKLDQGETKRAALAKAKQLWPSESWMETRRCKKAHSGMIDAALIAEYERNLNVRPLAHPGVQDSPNTTTNL